MFLVQHLSRVVTHLLCCRHVLKPQPLLDYTKGGVSGLGFKRCIGVRYKQYKWLADASETRGQGPAYQVASSTVPTGLYRFRNNSHVELKCHEVRPLGRDSSCRSRRAASPAIPWNAQDESQVLTLLHVLLHSNRKCCLWHFCAPC